MILKRLEDEVKLQVQLEDGRLQVLAVDPQHAIRESRGAEGKDAGIQRKEKSIQKRGLKKLSRLKQAGAYSKKRIPT